MKWLLVTDSSSNLMETQSFSDTPVGLAVVPLTIGAGRRQFVDDRALDVEVMMQALEASDKSCSAAPSPQAWLDAFERADWIIAFTITSGLSGSYASAYTARQMALEAHPEKRIFVLDTKSTGPEQSILIEHAARLAGQGLDFDAVCARLEQLQKRTHLLFVLESLDNLIKNGRVSKWEGRLAGALGVRLLGQASAQGLLQVLKKCRGMQVYRELWDQMIQMGFEGSRVVIHHCFNETRAQELKARILERFPQCAVTVAPARGLCSYYAQRGGVLVGFEGSAAAAE